MHPKINALRQRLRNKPIQRRLFRWAGQLCGKAMWQNLQTYCLFVGYTRSGHSAIGSVIDAHPQAIISHELHAIQRYFHGISRNALFAEIFWTAREQARSGRRSPSVDGGSYLHQIEGQLKQNPTSIHLIGDKKGAGTVRDFGRQGVDHLTDFKSFIGLPIKILHVLRNPFDMVAAAIVNNEVDQPYSFLQLVPTVSQIRARYQDANWLDIYYEDVIAHPKDQFIRILNFLNLPISDTYLNVCTEYLYNEPHKRRFEVQWTPDLKLRVQTAIDHYDFLHRYTWET